MQSYNPHSARGASLGYSLFARHYSGNHYCFLFLPVLRCFSSRGWLPAFAGYYTFSIAGLPIRRSRDIMLVCSSPWLIAAYHVLHRLSDPRHPPCALSCFKKIRIRDGACPVFTIVVVTRPHFFRPTIKWCDIQNCDRIVRYLSNIFSQYVKDLSKSCRLITVSYKRKRLVC